MLINLQRTSLVIRVIRVVSDSPGPAHICNSVGYPALCVGHHIIDMLSEPKVPAIKQVDVSACCSVVRILCLFELTAQCLVDALEFRSDVAMVKIVPHCNGLIWRWSVGVLYQGSVFACGSW